MSTRQTVLVQCIILRAHKFKEGAAPRSFSHVCNGMLTVKRGFRLAGVSLQIYGA